MTDGAARTSCRSSQIMVDQGPADAALCIFPPLFLFPLLSLVYFSAPPIPPRPLPGAKQPAVVTDCCTASGKPRGSWPPTAEDGQSFRICPGVAFGTTFWFKARRQNFYIPVLFRTARSKSRAGEPVPSTPPLLAANKLQSPLQQMQELFSL